MVATCKSSENSGGLCSKQECCCFFLDSGNPCNPKAAVVGVTVGGSFVPFPSDSRCPGPRELRYRWARKNRFVHFQSSPGAPGDPYDTTRRFCEVMI